MAGQGGYSVEILDRTQISAPPNSAPPSAIPLSFFDIPWLLCRPMQRLFFYDLPECSVLRFTETALPSLKRSLSAALGRFYPLAGGLACPPPPEKPHILCSDGDSVPFTVAVSAADFDELTSDGPQAAPLLHPLLPPLPPSYVQGGTRVAPLLAVQVTLFPNSGICIGVQFFHVAADGMAFNHFMKTWTSICRAELEGSHNSDLEPLPVLERTVIKHPNGLEPILLDGWFKTASTWEENSPVPSPSLYMDKLRASFTLTRPRIDRLKSWISNQAGEPFHVSTFVATCAYTWTCLIKSKEIEETEFPDVYHFSFVADCRGRLGYPIPETYFGNCLDICFLTVNREELVGPGGTVAAARAIRAKVKELESEGGPLRCAERWLSDWKEMSERGWLVPVAGSPRLRVYQTDFGWGRPRKSRIVHIDTSNVISIAESRDDEGRGIEVGLALGVASMDAFRVMFEQGLDS